MTITDQVPELDELDITTLDRYVRDGYPWHAWDLLREWAPVYRYERPGFPPFWAVTRYQDVHTVHSHPEVFINGGPILRLDTEAGLDGIERFKRRQFERYGWNPDAPMDMVFLDRPEHLDLRMLTMRRFTPASMRKLETDLAEMARHFVADFVERAKAAGGEPLDLVAKERHSVGALCVGREDLERLAADAEGAARECNIVARVLNRNELAQ